MIVPRRTFIKQLAWTGAGVCMAPSWLSCDSGARLFFNISLAEWSLYRTLARVGGEGTRDPLDFPLMARRDFGIGAIEYVNTFYFDKARDEAYLRELLNRCDGEGVKSLLIMCDQEGLLGDPDEAQRMKAVENHYKWIEAASFLGCHSIRVNAGSQGTWDEQMKLAADGLRKLCEYGDKYGINVIVENHGGLSSNGQWLTGVITMVDHSRCGTLPDFGNFTVSETEEYDRYKGVAELMPYAKGVSAKAHDFDEQGNETLTDYHRMLTIVRDAGYRGYIGIEYEGSQLSEPEGIIATKKLLEKTGKELS